MKTIRDLLKSNRAWSEKTREKNPGFFRRLSAQQAPKYLWIGCSDSRVPANQIVGMLPGELFVHRNVANLVVHTDLNCLSVIQYAVDVLRVKHIIVCGHYGCGGVQAVVKNQKFGLIDNWLRHIGDIYQKNERFLMGIKNTEKRINRLCELNVIEQVHNACRTTVVQNAWKRRRNLSVHGWIYGLKDGLIRDLKVQIPSPFE